MANLSGDIFIYTTNVTDERIYTILTLFRDDKLEHCNSDMTESQYYDAIARSVQLKYIDGISIIRTIERKVFLNNCYITDMGNRFIDNFES